MAAQVSPNEVRPAQFGPVWPGYDYFPPASAKTGRGGECDLLLYELDIFIDRSSSALGGKVLPYVF